MSNPGGSQGFRGLLGGIHDCRAFFFSCRCDRVGLPCGGAVDSLFRLRQLLWSIAAAAVLLLPGIPDAFARSYEWGTPTGYLDNSFCPPGPLTVNNHIRLNWLIWCDLGGNSYYAGSGMKIRFNGGNPIEGNALGTVPGLGEYTACATRVLIDGVWVDYPGCGTETVHYTGRTWAVCPVGDSETVEWQTTIASGNLSTGLVPTGSPPAQFCSDGCIVQGERLNGQAWIRPGEAAVGDDLWLGVEVTVTPGLCAPDLLNGTTADAALPQTACDPLSGECGGTTTGPGTGTGTGIHDGAIAGNTAALLAALNHLRQSTDLTTTGSYSNCAEAYTCSGDPLRCAQLTSLRSAYCLNSGITSEAEAGMSAEASEMLGETPTQLRDALKGGTGALDFAGQFSGTRWLSSGACPNALSFSVMGVSHSVGFDAFCQLAPIFSFVLVAGAALVAGRIFAGGLI